MNENVRISNKILLSVPNGPANIGSDYGSGDKPLSEPIMA